jgi:Poly(ADP-ribose) polymerase catalytic domain
MAQILMLTHLPHSPTSTITSIRTHMLAHHELTHERLPRTRSPSLPPSLSFPPSLTHTRSRAPSFTHSLVRLLAPHRDMCDAGFELSVLLFAVALHHYRRSSVCVLPPAFLASAAPFEVASAALAALQHDGGHARLSPQLHSTNATALMALLSGRLRALNSEEARTSLPSLPWRREALRPNRVFAVISPSSDTTLWSSLSPSSAAATTTTTTTTTSPFSASIFPTNAIDSGEEGFQSLRARHGSVLAFHGSALENVHSILTRGLQPGGVGFGERRELYGAGIYLSTDLSVAHSFLAYSSVGASTSSRSDPLLRGRLGCLAVCEVVRDPAAVRESSSCLGDGAARTVSIHSASDLPATYLVVRRATHVRVRYLLLYTSASPSPAAAHGSVAARSRVSSTLAIWVYAALLLLLVLWQTPRYRRYLMA